MTVWLFISTAVSGLLLSLTSGLVMVWEVLAGKSTVPAFDELLVLIAIVALSTCALWFWFVTTMVTIEAAHGVAFVGMWPSVASCPPKLRAALLAACGFVLATSVPSGSSASVADQQHKRWAATNLISGLPLPERATTSRAEHTVVADAPQPRTEQQAPKLTAIVEHGDTLWSVAARALPKHSTDTEISVTWHAIYEDNREVIGADPHVIVPGMTLSLSDQVAVER
jgi:hypothetical protein